jgi:hypothetical protein
VKYQRTAGDLAQHFARKPRRRVACRDHCDD